MAVEQLPRKSLFWVLTSLVAIIAPHTPRLPIWLLASLMGVTIWRVQVHRGVWSYPNRWVKWLLAFSSIAGLWLHYGATLSLEPMVALLIFSLMLKLLEMYRRRDAHTIIYLGFFVIATQWLFHSGLIAFLYGVACFFLLLMALLAIQLPDDSDVKAKKNQANHLGTTKHPLWTQGKLLIWMLFLSLPLMLVMFLFFPKLGSLWAVPQMQNQAETGVNDRMSPGDLSSLSRRGGRAFTVEFTDEIPSPDQLYWRGLVLSQFDGRTWKRSQWSGHHIRSATILTHSVLSEGWKNPAPHTQGMISDYQITLEPHQKTWLYALPKVLGIPSHIQLIDEWTLKNEHPVYHRTRYSVRSRLGQRLEETLSQAQRQRNLLLPVGYNPDTRKVAKQWLREGLSDTEIIQRFLRQVSEQFTYTLEPPLLGKHSVDEFLWQTQRGFCEHFASSFTFFMRAAGIPARVVVGYQGGEPVADFWQVTQADAHAWSEVWLEKNQSWERVDPTASVAPERIEHGIRDVFERPVLNPLSLEAYRHIPLLNHLRLRMDILNHRWQQQVLNFQAKEQEALVAQIKSYYQKISIKHVVLTSVALAAILFIMALPFWWQKRKAIPLSTRLLQHWEQQLSTLGMVRANNEGIQSFANRAQEHLPLIAKDIQRIARSFDQYMYQEDDRALPPLKQYLVSFTRQTRKVRREKKKRSTV